MYTKDSYKVYSTDGKSLKIFNSPSINDAGDVVFNGTFSDGGIGKNGIFTPTSLLVSTGDVIGGKTLGFMALPSINDAGDVVFLGVFQMTKRGIFKVNINTLINGPVPQTEQLISNVEALDLANGVANSLTALSNAALQVLDDFNTNNDAAACNSLQNFINVVESERNVSLSDAEADDLIGQAQAILLFILKFIFNLGVG